MCFDDELNVVHDYINDVNDLSKFRHSKYVKSNLNNSFCQVLDFLKKGKIVLFTGTPCQCAGLRAFLGREYDNLFTCDIICHANASPKVFNMFKANISDKYNSKIANIEFRNKRKYGWHGGSHTDITLENGNVYDIPEYTSAFLNDLINRPSCYACKFCTSKRYSDFTIGDLWGIDKISDLKDDNTGISLLCVNTIKGLKLFEDFKSNLLLSEIDCVLAFNHNHHSNVKHHPNRNKFFSLLSSKKINEKNIIDSLRKYNKYSLYYRVKNKFKRIIKRIIH